MISASEVPGGLLLALQRATHATLQELATAVVDLDLSASEINALGNLADGGPRTVSELGAAIGIRPTTLTGVLDRVERRGYVTRGPRPGDRRAVLIDLTPAGREVATTIRTAMAAVEERALARIPEVQLSVVRHVLEALAKGDE